MQVSSPPSRILSNLTMAHMGWKYDTQEKENNGLLSFPLQDDRGIPCRYVPGSEHRLHTHWSGFNPTSTRVHAAIGVILADGGMTVNRT